MAAPRLDAGLAEEDPRPDTPWWGVHAARYRFADRALGARLVLDVACGTGYGMEILTAGGRKVIGVDRDPAALSSARRAGPVVLADASALPFSDGAFDAVTSFETLEHLDDRPGFIAELARLLAPGAPLLLSTPNALYTKPVNGRPRNPFHVFEYSPGELLAELRRSFGDVEMFGQSLSPRFVISPFDEDQKRMHPTVRNRVRLLGWRICNRLPARARDKVSRLIWGHPLFPGAEDYVFSAESVESAPVLFVTARPGPNAEDGARSAGAAPPTAEPRRNG